MSYVSRSMKIAIALAGLASLSSCVSSPTYGTGKSATTQLVEDLGGAVLILNPNNNKKIDYEPRPDLVRPGKSVAGRQLVPPQQSVATVNNPDWVESPEEQRARLLKEIKDNEDNPSYRSSKIASEYKGREAEKARMAAFRNARKEATTIDISQKRYLIDPPEQYRETSNPDALNNLGQSERLKEIRRKKLAEGKDPDKCFLFLNCKTGATEKFLGDAPQ